MTNGLVERRSMPRRFRQQDERRRSQHLPQIFERDVERNRRMEDPRMRDHPQEFIDARPGDRPRKRSFGKPFQDLEGGSVITARLNLSVDQNIGVNRLHRSAPIHEIEQGVAIRQIDSGKLSRFPGPDIQPVGLPRRSHQRAAKQVVRYGLQSAALFSGFFLQLTQKAIFNRQSGSLHT